ncbi:von Willebrand factor type A domain protein [Lysobacter capsici]|uniref:substrate-binding and vWA domain-containing protein n=1 Tax=Lysobacter capsici TaxID=435897 RepID=UPI000716678A|nr:VWA domain-containing protein [Lysobacter capsici]ALN88822.1 von Willebrand factor type A domain protein [Lysobacter capsici]
MTRLLRLFAATVALSVLAACGGGAQDGASPDSDARPQRAFTVLAGSEIKDVDTQLGDDIRKATGIDVRFTYSGTLDAIDRLNAGEAFDAVWVSHGKYLAMNPTLKSRIKAQEKIMLSPVILGVKASKAAALGWDKTDPTWKDIADAAGSGRFTFGMTNPTASNTGFTAVIGIAAALASNPDALTEADVANPALKAFYQGQRMTAGSSGWLADAYASDPSKADGLINYESVILSLNHGGKLPEPLVPVYPKEGIITADYPLMLLDAGKRGDYDTLVAYLRSPAFQTRLSAATLRRPVSPDATAAAAIPNRTLIELPFPGQPQVIDRLLDSFLADMRIPSTSRYVLDLSGSMERDDRLGQLKTAMNTLAGGDSASLSSRYARFQNRERIGLLPFSSRPMPTRTFDMGSGADSNRATLAAIQAAVEPMAADGGTAIYDSVRQALLELASEKRSRPDKRYYTVVLMTDGENNEGIDLQEFLRWRESQDDAVRSIRVFPIIFGEADASEMKSLADATGGKAFDAKSQSLALVFKDIRGYQ